MILSQPVRHNFSIRDLMWGMLAVGLLVSWRMDVQRLQACNKALAAQTAKVRSLGHRANLTAESIRMMSPYIEEHRVQSQPYNEPHAQLAIDRLYSAIDVLEKKVAQDVLNQPPPNALPVSRKPISAE